MPWDRFMAASYDRWLTTPPEEYWDDEIPQPRCNHCGGFLKLKPDHTVTADAVVECDGKTGEWWEPVCLGVSSEACPGHPHWATTYGGMRYYWRCRKCHQVAYQDDY